MKHSRRLHFRRCHVCNHLTRKNERILKCGNCEKSFAPFFFFDDLGAPVLADNEARPNWSESYLPLRGFTGYW